MIESLQKFNHYYGDTLRVEFPSGSGARMNLGAVAREHQLSYYGLGVRNGDCRYTGATIAHVHAHVLVGDAGAGDAPPVRMRFSSRPGRPDGYRPRSA